MLLRFVPAMLVALLIPAAVLAGDDDAKRWESSSTFDNLKEAFNGESNAHAKYLAFAQKAEEEGYMPVASLFRAAARAEQIHAESHAKVIKALGGEAKAEIKLPEIKTTRENLLAAVTGESYERDKMYPAFLATAREETNREALRAFNFARTAEAEHAKLYQYAADHLEQLKGTAKVTYMVCTTCGYTVTKQDFTFSKCPSCFDPKDKYEAVQ
jgi:rubrerythrin